MDVVGNDARGELAAVDGGVGVWFGVVIGEGFAVEDGGELLEGGVEFSVSDDEA